MREKGQGCCGGTYEFFYIAMMHNSLANYYQLNFALMHHHSYSLTEIENMMPYERDIYVAMLKSYLEEQEEAMRK